MTLDTQAPTIRALREHHVRIETPDDNTLLLRQVPIHPDYFNKPRTNLLLKRARTGQPFVVCVDADLDYHGNDRALARVFTVGPRQNGWRILTIRPDWAKDAQTALENGLSALGFRGDAPRAEPHRAGQPVSPTGWMGKFGVDLTAAARDARDPPIIGRDDLIERLAACVLCWGSVRLGVVTGASGVGKTRLLDGLACLLAARRPDRRLLRLDVAELMAGTFLEAEREQIMFDLLREAHGAPATILALERLDGALTSSGVVDALIAKALDDGVSLVGTILPGAARRLRRAPLGRRIQFVALREPAARETTAILAAVKNHLTAHHGVAIDERLLPVAVRLAKDLPGSFPAKVIALLDQAAANAALLDAASVSPDDLCAATRHLGGATDDSDDSTDETGRT